MSENSPRAIFHRELADELEAMGLNVELEINPVRQDGSGGRSRDIRFWDNDALDFHGRIVIYQQDNLRYWLSYVGSTDDSSLESENHFRSDMAADEVLETVARFYKHNRDRAREQDVPTPWKTQIGPSRPVSPSEGMGGPTQGTPSPDDIALVRTALLARAQDASGDDRKSFAVLAVRLGATAADIAALL